LTVFIVPVQSDLFKVFVIVPSVKVIVLLIKFDIPVTVKEPSNVFNEYKLGVVIDDGVMIVEFEFEFVVIDDGVMIVELLFVSCIDKVGFSSVKVNELHKREPDEDPEILFELIIF
jgi:hypothetical protein